MSTMLRRQHNKMKYQNMKVKLKVTHIYRMMKFNINMALKNEV